MKDSLKNSQPDVTEMVKVSQVAIIVSVLVDVLEVKVKESKPLTTIADDDTLNEILNATEVHGAADEPSLIIIIIILSLNT